MVETETDLPNETMAQRNKEPDKNGKHSSKVSISSCGPPPQTNFGGRTRDRTPPTELSEVSNAIRLPKGLSVFFCVLCLDNHFIARCLGSAVLAMLDASDARKERREERLKNTAPRPQLYAT
ncbi:hypothetical protein DdX_17301 [Ditylenchus destructor]|uniref:Uncharacterized protein n=1 Tax=Ditylenchus destructor TaxID=166010 RepID=A0AAD4QZ98_9BILA|nr:hypothetical protein DdX_17301 [Ditylenchus destructor]